MRPNRRPAAGDQGFSLIEVLVSLGILSVVMIVVLGATVQIYSAVNRTEGTAFARDQLANSFRRLDKELRYASWVSTPGQVGTRWYLEYATPAGCRQLVLADRALTLASWTLPGTVPGTATTIAADVDLLAGTAPFTRYAARSTPYATASAGTAGVGRKYSSEYIQVRLRFAATVGRETQRFDTVFTAQNTSELTSALNDCSKGRPAT